MLELKFTSTGSEILARCTELMMSFGCAHIIMPTIYVLAKPQYIIIQRSPLCELVLWLFWTGLTRDI